MAELMDMLVEREVDFVLAFKPKEPLACVESHSLFQNFLTVVVNSNHPLASKQKSRLPSFRNMILHCRPAACRRETILMQ